MKNKAFLYSLLLICIVSCTHNSVDTEFATVCKSDTTNTISFSRDVIPLFVANCNNAGCHTGSNAAGHLCLDSAVAYSQLYQAGTGNIDTVVPKNSLLYSQLLSTADPMPPGGQLSKCDIAMIYKWIQEGGRNN